MVELHGWVLEVVTFRSNNELRFICSHLQLTLSVEKSSTCVHFTAFAQEG